MSELNEVEEQAGVAPAQNTDIEAPVKAAPKKKSSRKKVAVIAGSVPTPETVAKQVLDAEEERDRKYQEEQQQGALAVEIPADQLDADGLPIFTEDDLKLLEAMRMPRDLIEGTIQSARETYLAMKNSAQEGEELDASSLDMMKSSEATLKGLWMTVKQVRENIPSNEKMIEQMSLFVDEKLHNDFHSAEAGVVPEEGFLVSLIKLGQNRATRLGGTVEAISKQVNNMAYFYRRIVQVNQDNKEHQSNMIQLLEKISLFPTYVVQNLIHFGEEIDPKSIYAGHVGLRKTYQIAHDTSDFLGPNNEVVRLKRLLQEGREKIASWILGLWEGAPVDDRIGNWLNTYVEAKSPPEDKTYSTDDQQFWQSVVKHKMHGIRDIFSRAIATRVYYADISNKPAEMEEAEFKEKAKFSAHVLGEAVISKLLEIEITNASFDFGWIFVGKVLDNMKDRQHEIDKNIHRYMLSQYSLWNWVHLYFAGETLEEVVEFFKKSEDIVMTYHNVKILNVETMRKEMFKVLNGSLLRVLDRIEAI